MVAYTSEKLFARLILVTVFTQEKSSALLNRRFVSLREKCTYLNKRSIVSYSNIHYINLFREGWKVWSETALAEVCSIGIETSLVGDGGLGAGISIPDFWRIGIEAGSWGGTEKPAAWHDIGTDIGPSPFATDTGVPDSAKTGSGICIQHIGSRCKSASASSALSQSRPVS